MDWFKDDGIFMPMINDKGRNVFYKAAIESCVKDKVVVDIGTGSGFLTVIAAAAGAKKIYSIEKNLERYNFAKENFAKLGIMDQIEVIHADYLDTNIRADYYVSETIGNWLFDEDILSIAEHTKGLGGKFIPGSFELSVNIYDEHPIFSVVQTESEAYEFNPEIAMDDNFKTIINNEFEKNHPKTMQRHKSNMICNFFQQYKKMDDLKLKLLHTSPVLTVDLNNPIKNNIEFFIPKGTINKTGGARICLFWKSKFNDLTMELTDTIWCVPSKYIHKIDQDIRIYFDFKLNCWMFEYNEYE